ncbi:hypothetical protein GGI07_003837, partial [Coemansia sp. Benny D115]
FEDAINAAPHNTLNVQSPVLLENALHSILRIMVHDAAVAIAMSRVAIFMQFAIRQQNMRVVICWI